MVLKLDQLTPAAGRDLAKVDRTSRHVVGQSMLPRGHSNLTLVVWSRKDLTPVPDGLSLLGVTCLDFQGNDQLDLSGDWEHVDEQEEDGDWEHVSDEEHHCDWVHVDDAWEQDEGWEQVRIRKALTAGTPPNDSDVDPRLNGPLEDKLEFDSRKQAETESNELAKLSCLPSVGGPKLLDPPGTLSNLITLNSTCKRRFKDPEHSVSNILIGRNRDPENSVSTKSNERSREEEYCFSAESNGRRRAEADNVSTHSLGRNREQDPFGSTNGKSRIIEADPLVSSSNKSTQSPVEATQSHSAEPEMFPVSTEVPAMYTNEAFSFLRDNTNNNSPLSNGPSRNLAGEKSKDEGKPPGCCCQHSQNSALREMDVKAPPGYPVYDILEVKLHQENRKFDYITADGNCFFRAISKGFYGSENFYKTVRKHIMDVIAENKSQFAQFIDGEDVEDHISMMSQNHCWATTCEIYAAATLLQKDIYMLAPDHLNENYSWLLFRPLFEINNPGIKCDQYCYVTLCNTNGNHYDRVVPDHGGCNCFLPHPPLGTVGAP